MHILYPPRPTTIIVSSDHETLINSKSETLTPIRWLVKSEVHMILLTQTDPMHLHTTSPVMYISQPPLKHFLLISYTARRLSCTFPSLPPDRSWSFSWSFSSSFLLFLFPTNRSLSPRYFLFQLAGSGILAPAIIKHLAF